MHGVSGLYMLIFFSVEAIFLRNMYAQLSFILSLGGKLFGFVGIDIECKNTSISGDIGGLKMSTK